MSDIKIDENCHPNLLGNNGVNAVHELGGVRNTVEFIFRHLLNCEDIKEALEKKLNGKITRESYETIVAIRHALKNPHPSRITAEVSHTIAAFQGTRKKKKLVFKCSDKQERKRRHISAYMVTDHYPWQSELHRRIDERNQRQEQELRRLRERQGNTPKRGQKMEENAMKKAEDPLHRRRD